MNCCQCACMFTFKFSATNFSQRHEKFGEKKKYRIIFTVYALNKSVTIKSVN